MKTEKDLQNYIMGRAKKIGAMCHKMESKTARGWPDLIVLFDRQVVFIEVKSPAGTGSLSESQKRTIGHILTMGCTVFTLDAVEAVDAVFKDLTLGWYK